MVKSIGVEDHPVLSCSGNCMDGCHGGAVEASEDEDKSCEGFCAANCAVRIYALPARFLLSLSNNYFRPRDATAKSATGANESTGEREGGAWMAAQRPASQRLFTK